MAKYAKREPHPVGQPTYHDGAHYVAGVRCLAHGHCGTCGERIVMDKLGKYRHVSE